MPELGVSLVASTANWLAALVMQKPLFTGVMIHSWKTAAAWSR